MKENGWIDYELQKMKRKEKISANPCGYEKPALTIHLHNGDKATEDKGIINSFRNFIKDVLGIKNIL